ncbi:piggyBac transposable element-derived protein 4-like [Euwallacea similis]|uniref:piggyBac transposable element-derived protein 4-like n=1 Tax=Euwallacea similis TaxID=1736056 RepID=UPI00344B4948
MAMSQKRFPFFIRSIRFDDRPTRRQRKETDKLAAIRQIFTLFNENCKSHYILGQNVTVDEMFLLPAFRRRCGFRQYIPSKPSKYCIKMFSLCDAKLFYITFMEAYCGLQPEGSYKTNNSSEKIVLRPAESIYGSGRNITADNWFTSLKLVKALEEKKLLYVGTVRKNRRELPPNLIIPKNRPRYSIVLLSSLHVSCEEVADDTMKKAEIIDFYNSTNSGVNVADKLCATYNVARSTKRPEASAREELPGATAQIRKR